MNLTLIKLSLKYSHWHKTHCMRTVKSARYTKRGGNLAKVVTTFGLKLHLLFSKTTCDHHFPSDKCFNISTCYCSCSPEWNRMVACYTMASHQINRKSRNLELSRHFPIATKFVVQLHFYHCRIADWSQLVFM